MMEQVTMGGVKVSRLVIGGNPFSGFSHHSAEMDRRMRRYFTTARIKATLEEAESLGINTLIARTDSHIIRTLAEYWDEGGRIQWFAQTATELRSTELAVQRAVANGARGCYVHGGETDFLRAQGRFDEIQPAIDMIRQGGLAAGIAGHKPEIFKLAEETVDLDFYMCCYYNPSSRDHNPEHVPGTPERFREEDRRAMTSLIPNLSRPVIHYKVLAAGRNDPAEAFKLVARTMRADDAVCVGFYTEGKPDIIREDVTLLQESLAAVRVPGK